MEWIFSCLVASIDDVVGATGIEPVTPAVSRQRPVFVSQTP